MGGSGVKMYGNIATDDTKSNTIRNVAKALLSLNRLYLFILSYNMIQNLIRLKQCNSFTNVVIPVDFIEKI